MFKLWKNECEYYIVVIFPHKEKTLQKEEENKKPSVRFTLYD